MTHKTKFTTADFVILQVAEKEKIASFFNKREFFFASAKFIPAFVVC